MLPTYRDIADIDEALPIGFGQTISQPSTIALMLQWLNPQPNERVLDIGSGSGWTAALLSYLVRPHGHVFAIERIPELLAMGKRNCRRLRYKGVTFLPASNAAGLPDMGPFDKILVSAAADKIPDGLYEQVSAHGKIVLPIQDMLLELQHYADHWERMPHPGFIFVPLV